MKPGHAFYADWISGPTPHIYFVACETDNLIVLFNFTTHHPGRGDETCIVTPSEYGELKHDSVVPYRHGEILEGLALDHFRKSGLSRKLQQNITPELLHKIQVGAVDSRYTIKKIKDIFVEILKTHPSSSN
jgi:hypothetical protein